MKEAINILETQRKKLRSAKKLLVRVWGGYHAKTLPIKVPVHVREEYKDFVVRIRNLSSAIKILRKEGKNA